MPRTVWDLIDDATRKKLTKYQKRHYGVNVTPPDSPLVTPIKVVGQIEDLQEIDRIMRQSPRPSGRDE